MVIRRTMVDTTIIMTIIHAIVTRILVLIVMATTHRLNATTGFRLFIGIDVLG